jgi:hypothetical protein
MESGKTSVKNNSSCPGVASPRHGSLMSWLLCILVLCVFSIYAQAAMLYSLSSRQLAVVPVTVSASVPESVKKYESEYRYHEAVHESNDDKDTGTSMPMIPHNIIFTYKTNILEQKRPVQFYENVLHTIETYKQAWKAKDLSSGGNNSSDISVWFLDNQECRSVIQKVEPILIRHFDREKHGAFKSDICRAAALYVTGGYYFDIDMKVIQALILPNNVTFATSYGHRRDNFFQSFTAARQHSPILKEALDLMLLYYNDQLQVQTQMQDTNRTLEDTLKIYGRKFQTKDSFRDPASLLEVYESLASSGLGGNLLKDLFPLFDGDQKLHGDLIGPSTLKDACDRVMKENELSIGSSMVVNEESLILTEINLEDKEGANSGLYPNLLRQNGSGCCCNYVVHDPSTQTPFFFSRIVGASVRCQLPPAASAARRIGAPSR